MSGGLRLCLIWNKWSVRVCKREKAIRKGEIDGWGGERERERVMERIGER